MGLNSMECSVTLTQMSKICCDQHEYNDSFHVDLIWTMNKEPVFSLFAEHEYVAVVFSMIGGED